MWKGNEREVALKVLSSLRSEKHKNKSSIFEQPFDLNQVPGYLDLIPRPLALQTVENHLHAGDYDAKPEGAAVAFWKDLTAVFENAIKYHASKPATKWIAKFAKDMLKVVNRERKNAEKPKADPAGGAGASGGSSKPSKKKLKLLVRPMSATAGASSSAAAASAKSASSSSAATTATTSAAAASSTGAPTPAKKTKSIKIKLSTGGGASSSSSAPAAAGAAATTTTTTKPTTTKASSKQATGKTKTAVKAKPTQPKLRLTIKSKPKTTSPAAPATSATQPAKAAAAPAPAPKAAPAASTAAATTKKSTATKSTPKISLKVSRGKELPKGVEQQQQKPKAAASKPAATTTKPAAAASTTAKTTKKKPKKTKATTAKTTTKAATAKAGAGAGAAAAGASGGASKLSVEQKRACAKVLAGLRRRQSKTITWFTSPVSDKGILQDYRAKIKNPMDLSTVASKLDKGLYNKNGLADFVLDVRRIFANCLRYNTSIKDSLRPVAVQVMETAELLFKAFLLTPSTSPGSPPPFPPLVFCWKLCIEVLDTLYNLVNPENGEPTVLYFLHPVSVYCGGKYPHDYLSKIKRPMDFGTITGNLLEGRYQTVEDFSNDCRLVIKNCHAYYGGREDCAIYMQQADRLNEYLSRQLDQLARYVKTSKGASDRLQAAQVPVTLQPRPPPAVLLALLNELRAVKYTDKATKISEPAMAHFEKPVSLAAFPDYLQFVVDEPMDLQTVERFVNSGAYATPEDFEYHVHLIFKNCEAYNAARSHHLVTLAKYGAKQFRRLFYARMRALEDPTAGGTITPPPPATAVPPPVAGVAPPSSQAAGAGGAQPSRKIKISTAGAAGASRGKSAPRISITASSATAAAAAAAQESNRRSPKTVGAAANQKKNSAAAGGATAKAKNQPVPLHIAIARVKEAFPLRRAVKSLQSWEADCARYFRELMKHPWISAARPKFIFHVPVPTLFPELKDVYAAKIRSPMDLTTIECTLLAGNRYAGPEFFIRDIALVFSNAIRFNKAGREVGDPLSCAYYDASVHLLRFSRWLSLELLSSHVDENSEHTDEPGPDGLPPFSWRLTAGNRKKAREEMDALVMKEPIEKSLEGDRYTWHEAECEKLLKALRHQSDLRHMQFFIQPNYPPDYTAFIAKPMDWEKIQKTLKKRQYDTFGDVVSDLRLIFSNASKYNSRLKGTDTVSGRAYESAIYMSRKLELAINKMVLSVGDRLERERIDHANAEREIEAHERAEEEKIRAAWKKEPGKDGASPTPPAQADIAQKIRLVRRAAQRRDASDFEMPSFDLEDNGQHERSYFEVVKLQKSIYEKQTQERVKMRASTSKAGASVFARMLQREMAIQWVSNEASKMTNTTSAAGGPTGNRSDSGASSEKASSDNTTGAVVGGTAALSELEKEGRQKLQVKLVSRPLKKKPNKKRKRPLLDFE